MAGMNDTKTRPALRQDLPYENWKKEIMIWYCVTLLAPKKQALAIFLTLEGKAMEAVLEIAIESLNKTLNGS